MLFRSTYFQARVLQILHEEFQWPSHIPPSELSHFKQISEAVQKVGGSHFDAAAQIAVWSLRKELERPYASRVTIRMRAELLPFDRSRFMLALARDAVEEDLAYIFERTSE